MDCVAGAVATRNLRLAGAPKSFRGWPRSGSVAHHWRLRVGVAPSASRATAARRDAGDATAHRYRDGDRYGYCHSHASPDGDAQTCAEDATTAARSATAATRADAVDIWLYGWSRHKRQHLLGFLLVTHAHANIGRNCDRDGDGDSSDDGNLFGDGAFWTRHA